MTRCPYPGSGCNGPKESDCVGLPACFWLSFRRVTPVTKYRINTETMTKPVVAIKGMVEELPIQFAEPESNRFTAAWDAYKAHRAHSRIDGIRHAIRAFKGEA